MQPQIDAARGQNGLDVEADATARLSAGYFQLRAMGKTDLKGLTEALPLFELEAAGRAAAQEGGAFMRELQIVWYPDSYAVSPVPNSPWPSLLLISPTRSKNTQHCYRAPAFMSTQASCTNCVHASPSAKVSRPVTW